jgi:chlorophyll synthase
MCFVFIINSIADKDVDKFHNGRSKDMNLAKQPLVTGEISIKEAKYLSIVFLFLSLLFAWLINYYFFLIIITVDIVGYVYSMPPTRLKTKPVGDIICNMLLGGGIFIGGLVIGGDNINPFMILGGFIMAAIFYLPTVVTDYEFDKKASLKTSAVVFTPKKLIRAMYPLTAILAIVCLIVYLTGTIELKFLAILIVIYSIIFTLASNFKLKEGRLYIHENWILAPFIVISIAFVIYGLLKLAGLVIL